MEEIIKSPITHYLVGAIVLLAQLYLRSQFDAVKKQNDKIEKNIEKLFDRTDKITSIETDLGNLRDECRQRHRG